MRTFAPAFVRLSAAFLPSLLIIAAPAQAQTTHDEGAWINATVMGPVDGRVVFFAEVQPRINDGVSRLTQLLLRPAIGYAVSDDLTIYQGYARVIDAVENGSDLREDRLFQQVTWNVGKIGKLEVQSRTRLEERWRSDGDGMSLRVRQMMRFEYPLAAGKRRVAALASSEAFVGLKSAQWGGVEGFDQLRTFAGVEIPLPGTSTLEAGYLNQTRDAPGQRVNMVPVASLTLFVRL
ncbi:DUF2490 domain-containing protein [Sphingomonas radiodurans]|uniref:DUF2490 domain-containing protein n=1 Tax=Sphingomonas radiodurans TaxID=2890321 RepID=UPI001E3B32EF|nr:DUF2490 domain-containing protein [Sphingomonas radiodurans]WBH17914.1 DUF2490 domain-containing protein [Sphingomonas radiodurans]